MINIANLDKLIQALENEELLQDGVKFSMYNWCADLPSWREVSVVGQDGVDHKCHTAACIAGHAYLLSRKEAYTSSYYDVEFVARQWLGLQGPEADLLFKPPFLGLITQEWAIRTLRHLRETGIVDYASNCPEELKEEFQKSWLT